MSDQSSLTPRQSEALAVYDSLPESERSYANVAQALGVTEGRAGVYVREAMAATGRTDTPRRGRGNGQSSKRTVSPFEAQIEQLIAANEATVQRLEAQIEEAREAARTFDADAWIEAETKRLDEIAKEARARATAFSKNEGEIAMNAATEQEQRLNKRVEEVTDANEEQVATARNAMEQARAMLATLTEQPS